MRLTTLQPQRHTTLRTPLHQHIPSITQRFGWRHPLVGYAIGLLLVALGLGVGIVETQVLSPLSFPGLPLLVSVILVALFWGVGPALFSILLSVLVLDYFYVPPFGTLSGYGWNGVVQLLTFAAAGIIIAVLADQREIAQARAIEAEREASLRARQLEATFDAMNDGVVVYNQKGQVVQTNAATRALFGITALPKNEQEQREQELLLQAIQCNEQGETLAVKRQPLSRLLTGESLTGTKATDVLVHTPDGRRVVFNLSGAAIRNETGKIERAVVMYRDVTERRQLEQRTSEALQALLAMAQALVQFPTLLEKSEQTTPTAMLSEQLGQRLTELSAHVIKSMHVVMLAIESETQNISHIASTGLTPLQEEQWREQLTHTSSLVDMVGSEQLITHLQNDEVLLLDGMSLPLYTHVLPYYVQAVLVAPINVNNRLVGLLCLDDGSREHTYTANEMMLAQTIARLASLMIARTLLMRENTEARANELALRETNRRMEEFLSIVCHELKAPLTVIHGSLQLAERKVKRLFTTETFLADELKRFAPVQALLERAKHATIMQDRLVNDLLDVSRVQAGTLKLYKAQYNLVNVVQEAVEDQRQITNTRVIELDLPSEPTILANADADRIVQVVTNLLTNALKYSPQDHPVTVSLRVEEQDARVAVRDEGPGLSLAKQERIWECFYRVPDVNVKNGSNVGVGLGVGLHLCRNIIEQHGGQIGVQSEVGQGSTFWFSLPLVQVVE